MEKVAGSDYYGACHRCGGDDHYGFCNHKWYGKLCCEKCFKILSNREEKDYNNDNSDLMKELKLLEAKIDNLIKNNKFNNYTNNNNNN